MGQFWIGDIAGKWVTFKPALTWRYCRAVDRRDFAALRVLYMADAIDEHGGMFQGPADEFIDLLPNIMAPMEVVWHMTGNMLIEIQGDEGEGEIYTFSYHRADLGNGPEDLVVGGRYLDRYGKEDGQWKFRHRKIVMDWNQIGPSKCQWDSALFAGTPRGQTDSSDPAHSYFKWLGNSN